ncbi:MAG TPA: FG-GAP-like repeat-containing protein [Pyrinomonadaceae bacterium]|nr:FG-GAP-like repeat-containing protein [Pyrinomonadaceae bacterium]
MLKKLSFRPFSVLGSVLLACFLTQASFAQNNRAVQLKEDLNSSFRQHDLIRLDPSQALDAVTQKGRIELQAGTRQLDLTLVPRDLRSPLYRAEETIAGGALRSLPATHVQTFKGSIAGEQSSQVRLTVSKNKIEGLIIRDGEKFFLEPAKRFSASADANDFVLYNGKDLTREVHINCDLHLEDRVSNAASTFAPRTEENASLSTVVRVAEIATEADFQFVTTLGGAAAANAEILSILNMVEGAYQNEVGVAFEVTYQHVWTTSDPFPNGDAQAVLLSFQSHWNANFPVASYPRDLAHLFSGRANLMGQGRAVMNAVCRPESAYGLNGRFDIGLAKYTLAAHEIGHNFGANHAEGAQACADTIMNAGLTNLTPLTFCQFSRGEVSTYATGTTGGCLTPRALTSARADFDGDQRTDLSVFRPTTGDWFAWKSASSSLLASRFGQLGDLPVAGDYDGDRRTDIAVYRGGNWYILLSQSNAFRAVNFGLPTDVPAQADFTGDGLFEVAVFRPESGAWYILNLTNNAFTAQNFGSNGDIPTAADYDGDGSADISVFRPSNGTWYRLNSRGGAFFAVNFGSIGDKPVPADYDGDGKADVSVFRPSGGAWYSLRSSNNAFTGTNFGLPTDIPVPGDFDGDGRTDISVFRPSNGAWYRLNSSSGNFVSATFGTSGDMPIPAR